MKGAFITVEGIDGSGKSTLCHSLHQKLQKMGFDVVLTRAPGGTETGAKIRELILHGHLKDIKSELFLLADRAEHVATCIRPALEAGKIVLCDRFSDSTVAYQSQRGLEASRIETLCDYATGNLKPDMTLLVDLDPEVAFLRLEKTRQKDRIENEGLYLLTKIHQAYLDLAKRHKRITLVDGQLSASELLQVSLDHVSRFLDQR